MRPQKVLAFTFYTAAAEQRNGKIIGQAYLSQLDAKARKLAADLPNFKEMKVELEGSGLNADTEIDVRLTPEKGLERIIGPLHPLVKARAFAVAKLVTATITERREAVNRIIDVLAQWMSQSTTVRVVGAGRALLAVSLPANRLAHGGARVSILGDRAPLPHSRLGGSVLAASASGQTREVLDIMKGAINRGLTVVGISKAGAEDFKNFCTHFVGIDFEREIGKVRLRTLGDIEELTIAELLDALIVAAGQRVGIVFRYGHEDLGARGPWD